MEESNLVVEETVSAVPETSVPATDVPAVPAEAVVPAADVPAEAVNQMADTAANAVPAAADPGMFDALRGICDHLAGYTPWCALVIALVAIALGFKNGFKKKSLSETIARPGLWAWLAVVVLWVVVMLNYFDRQLLSVLNHSITEGENGINMTQGQFGLVTSAFLVVYAILSPIGGYLADKFSRKFIILCSLVVWSVVTWATGKSTSFEELIFWRGAMGVSEAFYIPAALALISDYHRGSTRSMATGLHMSGIYAGQMLAGCGALMAGSPVNLGWRLTFETFGFIGVAYAIVVVFLMRDPEGSNVPAKETASEDASEISKEVSAETEVTFMQAVRGIFTGRAMYMLLAMYAFAGFANWFLMGWYPRLLQDVFGLSEAEAGPQATLWINGAKYGAVLLAAVVADLWYSRRGGNARAYVPGICFCLAGPCVMIAMFPGMAPLIGLAGTLALVATQGVAQGSLDATLMPVLRSHIDERFSATGYGLLNLTSVSAGALISWLGGYLKDMGIGLGVPLLIAGALLLICGAFFFLLPKPRN